MKKLYKFLATKENQNEIWQWHFIPPNAPQFGELWEAGIKQVKFHLKRVPNRTISINYLVEKRKVFSFVSYCSALQLVISMFCVDSF